MRALENGETIASSSDEESSGSSTDDDEDVQCKPVGPSIGRSVKNGQTSFSVSTMLDNICVELDGGDDLQFAVDMHLLLAEIRTRCEPQLANAQKTKPKLHRNVSFIKDFYFDEQANEALDSVLKEAGISRDLLQLRFHVKVDAKQWLKESVCLPVTNRFEEVLKLRQLFSNATTQGLEVFRSLCISKLMAGTKEKDPETTRALTETYLNGLMKSNAEMERDRKKEQKRQQTTVSKFRQTAEDLEKHLVVWTDNLDEGSKKRRGEVKKCKARLRWYKQPNLTMEELRRGPPDDLSD